MARLRKGSKNLIRDLNLSAILALIGDRGPIARVEIARELALSQATVTVLTRELVRDGLVREVAPAPSRGGRPGVLLGLVGEAAHALGVKIAPERLTFVRVNLEGEPLGFSGRPFDATAPDAIDQLLDAIEDVTKEELPGSRLLGIGLGVPGIVDARTGVVDSPVLGWDRLPVGPRVFDRFGVPVLMDNDVNTLAGAERLYGRGRGIENFLTVTIGRGVGLGIVVAGDVYHGAYGGAGEFGHIRMVDDGPLCQCGKHGCLEALVSDVALVEAGQKAGLLGTDEGIAELRALAEGNVPARRLFKNAGATLGRAVASLVNVLSPQLVLVGGEGTQAWALLCDSFEVALREDIFQPLRAVPVEVDPWDDAKWARGAAALVLRATFSAPIYEFGPDDAVRARLGAGAEARAAGNA